MKKLFVLAVFLTISAFAQNVTVVERASIDYPFVYLNKVQDDIKSDINEYVGVYKNLLDDDGRTIVTSITVKKEKLGYLIIRERYVAESKEDYMSAKYNSVKLSKNIFTAKGHEYRMIKFNAKDKRGQAKIYYGLIETNLGDKNYKQSKTKKIMFFEKLR